MHTRARAHTHTYIYIREVKSQKKIFELCCKLEITKDWVHKWKDIHIQSDILWFFGFLVSNLDFKVILTYFVEWNLFKCKHMKESVKIYFLVTIMFKFQFCHSKMNHHLQRKGKTWCLCFKLCSNNLRGWIWFGEVFDRKDKMSWFLVCKKETYNLKGFLM